MEAVKFKKRSWYQTRNMLSETEYFFTEVFFMKYFFTLVSSPFLWIAEAYLGPS